MPLSVTILVAAALLSVLSSPFIRAERFDPLAATGMNIMGYADRISVQPGETIRFMVSCSRPRYRADIVRLRHGDEDPRGPGFRETPIETSVPGEYPGRRQTWDRGSYVQAPDHPALRLPGSFTLQAWIYPTAPAKGAQGILTRWDEGAQKGYGLFLDEDGSLALWVGDGPGKVFKTRTGVALRSPQPFNGSFHESNWYFVAAVFETSPGRVRLVQQPLKEWPGDESRAVAEVSTPLGSAGDGSVPLLISGYWAETPPDGLVAGHFNGKVENPRVFNRPLTHEELEALRRGEPGAVSSEGLTAAWDFALDIDTDRVSDTSPHALHGRAVNMPKRAVTGRNWRGREMNYRHAPAEYGALHFHDDALEDARWEADFEFRVPDGLKSGVYAARLRTEDGEDYVPFLVRPRKGAAASQIAFLLPTFTYLAYANIGNACEVCRRISSPGLYGRHSDGTGVFYSSFLRPILDMRPRAITRWRAGGETPRHFSADLYMIDWLEEKGFDYDVIGDGDLHAEGLDLLSRYNVVVTGSHPEYVTEAMLDALEAYLTQGGRLMYMGGNGFYWVTSVAPGKPHIIEVRKWGGTQSYAAAPGEYYHSTTGELGGLWRGRGRHPQKLVGIGFTAQGFDRNATYRRHEDSFKEAAGFIFEEVGESEEIGAFESLGMGYGAAGDELDRFEASLGSPPGTLVLATAADFSDAYQLVVEEVLQTGPGLGGGHPSVRADMVYLKYPNFGAVFSAGSISWFGSLSANNYDNNVSRITENVLRRFASREPLP